MINYTFAKTDNDLRAIRNLQKANLKQNISQQEAAEQGFVTCNHTLQVLKMLNHPHPHIIAKHQQQLIGYALVMLKIHKKTVPEITSMFTQINQLTYQGNTLKKANYVVMGQICIAKNYRSQGIFRGLYQTMFTALKPHFQYIITDIVTTNTRSIKAHQKVGFQSILTFTDDLNEWEIVLKNLN